LWEAGLVRIDVGGAGGIAEREERWALFHPHGTNLVDW
jgi:hypothetical protein